MTLCVLRVSVCVFCVHLFIRMNCSEFEELWQWQWQWLSSYPDDKRTMGLSELRSLRRNLIVDSLCWSYWITTADDYYYFIWPKFVSLNRNVLPVVLFVSIINGNAEILPKCWHWTFIYLLVLWYDAECVHFLAILLLLLLLFWNAAIETQYTTIHILWLSVGFVYSHLFLFLAFDLRIYCDVLLLHL